MRWFSACLLELSIIHSFGHHIVMQTESANKWRMSERPIYLAISHSNLRCQLWHSIWQFKGQTENGMHEEKMWCREFASGEMHVLCFTKCVELFYSAENAYCKMTKMIIHKMEWNNHNDKIINNGWSYKLHSRLFFLVPMMHNVII